MSSLIFILSNPASAIVDDGLWSLLRFLLKYFKNYDSIAVRSVHDSPNLILILDPKFVTSDTYYRHRTRMWQRQFFMLQELKLMICSREWCVRLKRGTFL